MALSNIFKEPRRELTEQVVGLAAILGFFGVLFALTAVVVRITDGTVFVGAGEFLASALVLLLGLAMFFFFSMIVLFAMHEIGEALCNAMARRGHDPRPTRETKKWRY